MASVATEIAVILVLLVINGVFALSEISVVASKRVRLEGRAERGDRGAQAALRLLGESTQFLSTVQVGITLIGVLAGAFGGATLTEILAARFRQVPWLAPRADAAALAIVVGAITYLSLIIGELVPKQIGLHNPERIAALVARPMELLAKVTAPVVKLLTFSTTLVVRLIGLRGGSEPGMTEQEIHTLLEQGAEAGVVPEVEHALVESVFRLGDRQVATIMTPRPDIDWLDADSGPDEVRAQLARAPHALLVVCDGSVENVRGVVRAEDLLVRALGGEPLDLRTAIQQPLYVPGTMPVFKLLETFKRARQHAAVVLDEYGGVQGLATMDDILEGIVGEVPEGDEVADTPIVRRADGSWLVDGMTPIEDVEAELDLPPMPADERRGYRTLGGFVLTRLGHLPAATETFVWSGYRFEVVDMDGRRVDKVLVTPPRPAPVA